MFCFLKTYEITSRVQDFIFYCIPFCLRIQTLTFHQNDFYQNSDTNKLFFSIISPFELQENKGKIQNSHFYGPSYCSIVWFAGIIYKKNIGNFPLCLISQEKILSTQTSRPLLLVFFLRLIQTYIPTKFLYFLFIFFLYMYSYSIVVYFLHFSILHFKEGLSKGCKPSDLEHRNFTDSLGSLKNFAMSTSLVDQFVHHLSIPNIVGKQILRDLVFPLSKRP